MHAGYRYTNKFSNMCYLLVGAFHYTILEAGYDLKKLLKYPVFPALPE
jgi:hypothetical protein